jgi:hypothetical protein
MERAAVHFYPVEECWVHQNRDKRAIAILELDRKPQPPRLLQDAVNRF